MNHNVRPQSHSTSAGQYRRFCATAYSVN